MSSRRERFLDIDPEQIFFTHTRIRPFFSGCGRRLVDTLESLDSGSMHVDALPQITILATPSSSKDGEYFSLNNRRLWVLKQLRAKGKLKDNLVKVRVKDALPRELDKYAKEGIQRNKHATLMGAGDSNIDKDDEVSKERGDELVEKISMLDEENSKCEREKHVVTRPPPLSAEAKTKLKTIGKKIGKLKGKNSERQITSLIDELIISNVISESQESLARAELSMY